MELPLEELKAPIEVHFADGISHPTKLQAKDVPLQLGNFADGISHPTKLQAKDVPLQLGNWKGKVDLLVSTLKGMDCILGMEFITRNNVLIEGHNRLVKSPSKNGIV